MECVKVSDIEVNGWQLVPRIDAKLSAEEQAHVEELLRKISENFEGGKKR